jgi:hypothetical protein
MNEKESLQYKIINSIQSILSEGLLHNKSRIPNIPKNSKFYEKFKDIPKEKLGYKIFSNFRLKNGVPQGLRLTSLGNEILKRNFEYWDFSHDINPTPKMYLFLDDAMEWPYYFTKKKLVLYCKEDAAWYKLNGNDIHTFIDKM